jgi:ABC-2 type transport system permease protein
MTNAIRAEWTKLWSIRSTFWTLLALVVVAVGLSALIAAATVSSDHSSMGARNDPTGTSLSGLGTGQLVIVVLGVMVISTEYITRSIRTSLIATPRRLTFLSAKAIVLAGVALVVGMVTSFGAYVVGQAILATEGINGQISDPGVLRAVIGGGLFLAGSAMFGFALGALLRSTAGGITVAIAGLVVLPQLAGLLPGRAGELVQTYLTSNAGRQVMQVTHLTNDLGPWSGYAVFTLWWLVPLIVAAVLMQRRDV